MFYSNALFYFPPADIIMSIDYKFKKVSVLG